MHRLFNHKKGNSISTTTPSSTAIPSSAKSTPLFGHRRNHSATPEVHASPRKIVKPSGKFKPAPAPLHANHPVVQRMYAMHDPTKPFFATVGDGYLDNVPTTVPASIAPRDMVERDALGRRVDLGRNETMPTCRPQRAAHPAPASATVSGRPSLGAKRDNCKPPASRSRHFNHHSDSAVHLLSPSQPHRPDSPLPADVCGKQPRALRKTGHLNTPKPKSSPGMDIRPSLDSCESVYMTQDEVWTSMFAADPRRPYFNIQILNPSEPDVFQRAYRCGDYTFGPADEKFWRTMLWTEETAERDGNAFPMRMFIPEEVRDALEEKIKVEKAAIIDARRVTRPPPGEPLPKDFNAYVAAKAVFKPAPSAVVKPVPPVPELPPITKRPRRNPCAGPLPNAKPLPTTRPPPTPSKTPTTGRKPGMFWAGKPRESGFKVPAHIEYRYEWLPRHVDDMTDEELDVLYDVFREQILEDCTRWHFLQGTDERFRSIVPTTYNRSLQNAINHNPGIPLRNAQRIALDRVINTVEDLGYDIATTVVKEWEPTYRELLYSVEKKKAGKMKEVRRGNVARTAVAVPPGAKPPAELSSRPLSYF